MMPHRQVGPHGLKSPDTGWMRRAACRGVGVDVFFVEPLSDVSAALSYCRRCEVKQECLAYALDNNLTSGVYGGMPPRRRSIYRRRAS